MCNICQAMFVLNVDFHLHKKSHDNKNKTTFICSWENCKKICTSSYSLKTHRMKHEGQKRFLCVTCGKVFFSTNQRFIIFFWISRKSVFNKKLIKLPRKNPSGSESVRMQTLQYRFLSAKQSKSTREKTSRRCTFLLFAVYTRIHYEINTGSTRTHTHRNSWISMSKMSIVFLHWKRATKTSTISSSWVVFAMFFERFLIFFLMVFRV